LNERKLKKHDVKRLSSAPRLGILSFQRRQSHDTPLDFTAEEYIVLLAFRLYEHVLFIKFNIILSSARSPGYDFQQILQLSSGVVLKLVTVPNYQYRLTFPIQE